MTHIVSSDTDGAALVTKSPNRARKPVSKAKKFEPIPEFDAGGRKNKVPTPAQQESIAALLDSYTEKDRAVIVSFVSSAEFMAPGYGNSARFVKMWMARQPKAVKLPR